MEFPDEMLWEIMTCLYVEDIENAGLVNKRLAAQYIPEAKKIRIQADQELYVAIQTLYIDPGLAVELVKASLIKGANPNKLVKAFDSSYYRPSWKSSPILYEVLWNKFRTYGGEIIIKDKFNQNVAEKIDNRSREIADRLRYAEENLIEPVVTMLRENPELTINELPMSRKNNGITEEAWILKENRNLDLARYEIVYMLLHWDADPLQRVVYDDREERIGSYWGTIHNAFTITIAMGDYYSLQMLIEWQEFNKILIKYGWKVSYLMNTVTMSVDFLIL